MVILSSFTCFMWTEPFKSVSKSFCNLCIFFSILNVHHSYIYCLRHLHMMHIQILEKEQHFYACSIAWFGFLNKSRKEKNIYGCSHFILANGWGENKKIITFLSFSFLSGISVMTLSIWSGMWHAGQVKIKRHSLLLPLILVLSLPINVYVSTLFHKYLLSWTSEWLRVTSSDRIL